MKTNETDAAREAGQKTITEILEAFPCPQCGAVEVLTDAPIPGATCDCGRKEGCQTRWELGDIWSQMSDAQKQQATEAEAAIEPQIERATTDQTNTVSRDAEQTDAAPFQYFGARLLGWNGSRSRVIVDASGCWDTESDAQAALDAASDKRFHDFCDGLGLDPAEDESMDWFCGINSDYQRTSTTFTCVPSVDGRLDHSQQREVSPGELPMLDEE